MAEKRDLLTKKWSLRKKNLENDWKKPEKSDIKVQNEPFQLSQGLIVFRIGSALLSFFIIEWCLCTHYATCHIRRKLGFRTPIFSMFARRPQNPPCRTYFLRSTVLTWCPPREKRPHLNSNSIARNSNGGIVTPPRPSSGRESKKIETGEKFLRFSHDCRA